MCLHDLYFSSLSHAELAFAGRQSATIVLGSLQTLPHVIEVATDLNVDVDLLESILLRSRAGGYAEILEEKDLLRDEYHRALTYHLMSWAHRRDALEKRESARILLEIFGVKGAAILKYGYAEESVEMNALFQALSTESAIHHLAVVEADSWLNLLKDAEADFEKTYQSKVVAFSKKDRIELKATSATVAHTLDDLLTMVNRAGSKPNESVAAAIKQLNVVIDEVMIRARARRTRSEGDSTEADSARPPATKP